jgi:hypothetical protein
MEERDREIEAGLALSANTRGIEAEGPVPGAMDMAERDALFEPTSGRHGVTSERLRSATRPQYVRGEPVPTQPARRSARLMSVFSMPCPTSMTEPCVDANLAN